MCLPRKYRTQSDFISNINKYLERNMKRMKRTVSAVKLSCIASHPSHKYFYGGSTYLQSTPGGKNVQLGEGKARKSRPSFRDL